MTKTLMLQTIIIHTARTWERIRLVQPHQEMNQDNIESIDCILEIADEILNDEIIQGFLKTKNRDDYWEKNTDGGFSDWYIESLAEKIITENYLD